MKNNNYTFILTIIINIIVFSAMAQQPNWTVNAANYSSSFSVNSILNFNGIYTTNTNDMVAAFDQNDSIRGVANVIYDSGLNDYIVYLTVLGNTSTTDTITFKMYDALADTVYLAINDPLIYVPNQLIGTVNSKYVISNSNFATGFSLSDTSIVENNLLGDTIGALNTTLVNPNTSLFTYALVAGFGDVDNGSFIIAGTQIIANSVFDYETQNQYSVRVRSVSNSLDTNETVFLIQINDINELPTAILLDYDSIAENNTTGAPVGNLFTADQDTLDNHTYTIVSTPFTDYADFTIAGNTLVANSVFNYELKNQYIVDVKTTDLVGGQYVQQFSIFIQNVYEPTLLSLSNQNIQENLPIGTIVGTLSNVGDSTGTYTYQLVAGVGGDNNSNFTITNGGLQTAIVFDYEALLSDTLTILTESTDGVGNTEQQAFLILIEDVNEAPTAILLGNDSITENNAIGDTIGLLSTTDIDFGDTFTYTIEQTPFTDFTDFVIVNNALRTYISFNYEIKNSYVLDITSTDASGSSIAETFAIKIIDVLGEITGVEMQKISPKKVKIYPNPTNGLFVVKNLNREYTQMIIRDITGRIVLRQSICSENIEVILEETSGLYFVEVLNQDSRIISKLIIQ